MWHLNLVWLSLVAVCFGFSPGWAQDQSLIAWWRFDDVRSAQVLVQEEEEEEEEQADEDEADEQDGDEGFVYEGDTSLLVSKSDDFDMTSADYTVVARIRTDESGSIFSKAAREGRWSENGKTLFVSDGRLAFDVGWVGTVESEREVADGDWHHVAMTFDHDGGRVQLFVDGKPDTADELAPAEAVEGHVVRIGFTSPDFPDEGRGFEGRIDQIGFYSRVLNNDEIAKLASGKVTKDGLVAEWRDFDHDADMLIDATKRGHDGQLEDVEIWEDQEGIDEEEEDEEEDEEEEPIREQRFFVRDEVSGTEDILAGFHKLVPGISGKALRLGGINTYIVRAAEKAGSPDAFSVEAWLALGAYPVHWVPIIGQQEGSDRGGFFGIDANGHLGLKLSISGQWQELVSDQRIELGRWAHVACVYQPHNKMQLFLDGRLVGEQAITGTLDPAEGKDLLIGRHSLRRKPLGTIRPFGTKDVYTYLDGILDELKVYGRTLSADEIAANYRLVQPEQKPELPLRELPAGPKGAGKFGAFYTTLKYYDAWDALWRVGGHADVVVRFDEHPCRFVFWRGTSYIPHWVTENGIWYDNEFNETWSEHGCHEPMSDKQCRHAHVRIIENNDARVVVHWRYALVDNWYEIARVDDVTGWGDWTDELYTIYPDGVGVRKVTLHSTHPEAPHEWHEGIIVMGPGQRPESVLKPEALTLLNMDGDSRTYSWAEGAPGEDGVVTEPQRANIQIVNTKSKYRPLVAVRPQSEPEWDIYDGELRRDVSMFPWWNHWPTAQDACDGRYAMAADRASHSSLTHCHWGSYEQTENSMTKIMLNGLTDKSPDDVIQLVKSWATPPTAVVQSAGFSAKGYDPSQRAYVFKRDGSDSGAPLSVTIGASGNTPLVNVALLVQDWGEQEARVAVDGELLQSGKQVRQGHRTGLSGSDLVVWIKTEATKPLSVVLRPAAK